MATVNPATILSKSIDGWLYLLVTWLGKKKASTLGVKAVGKHKLVDRSGNYFIRTNQAEFLQSQIEIKLPNVKSLLFLAVKGQFDLQLNTG
jgi:hypothetical protein